MAFNRFYAETSVAIKFLKNVEVDVIKNFSDENLLLEKIKLQVLQSIEAEAPTYMLDDIEITITHIQKG